MSRDGDTHGADLIVVSPLPGSSSVQDLSSAGDQGLSEVLKAFASSSPLRFRVRGHCMEPLITAGSTIEVAASRRLWPGDVIAFSSHDRKLVLHRVLGFRPVSGGWKIVTQADAAKAADVPVDPDQVIGKLIGGECSRLAIAVPVRHRLRAIWRFGRLLVARLLARPM